MAWTTPKTWAYKETLSSSDMNTYVKDNLQYLYDRIGAWKNWTPSFSASGSMTFTSVTVDLARYVQIGKLVFFQLVATGTTGGTASNAIYFTLPVTAAQIRGTYTGLYADGGGVRVGTAYQTSTTQVAVLKEDLTNFGLGSGRAIRCSGFYEVS